MLLVSKYTSLRGNLSIQNRSVVDKTVAITYEPQGPGKAPILFEHESRVVIEKARESSQEACESLVNKRESSQDTKLAEGARKCASRLQRLTTSMGSDLTSSLFILGVNELSIRKKGEKVKCSLTKKENLPIRADKQLAKAGVSHYNH